MAKAIFLRKDMYIRHSAQVYCPFISIGTWHISALNSRVEASREQNRDINANIFRLVLSPSHLTYKKHAAALVYTLSPHLHDTFRTLPMCQLLRWADTPGWPCPTAGHLLQQRTVACANTGNLASDSSSSILLTNLRCACGRGKYR